MQRLGDFTQHVMIVRLLVFRNTLPVDSRWSGRCIWILLQNLLEQLFRFGPLLLHDVDARQSQQELRGEFVFGQIAFDAETLLTILIQDDRGRRPDRFKASKSGGIFLDVDADRNEVLFDEGGKLRVCV